MPTMKRPTNTIATKMTTKRRPAATHACAAALALALAGGVSDAAQQHHQQAPPVSRQHVRGGAGAAWKQFETTSASSPLSSSSVGRHQYRNRRRYGRNVEEKGDAVKKENNKLAGAVGGLWDNLNLRRRPRDDKEDQKKKEEDQGAADQGQNNESASNSKEDINASDATNNSSEENDAKQDQTEEADNKTEKEGTDEDDDGEKDKDEADTDTSDVAVSTMQQSSPSGGPNGGHGRPMYIVRPRPGLQNHPNNSPLGGLLIPSGASGLGLGGGLNPADPSSPSSQSVQSALLSALSKVLIATLLTPGGLRNNPLLSWLLPRRSRERPYLPDPVQRYTFERLNDRYERDGAALERALLEMSPAADRVGHYFWSRRSRRSRNRHQKGASGRRQRKATKTIGDADEGGTMDGTTSTIDNPKLPLQEKEKGEHRTVIVLDFCTDPNSPSARHLPTPGHTHAPAEGHAAPHDPVEMLRDQVSFVLEQYHDPAVRSLLGRQVEVVLRVESGGGGVQDFGVAADAVRRIRDAAAAAGASSPSSSSSSSTATTDASSHDAIAGDERSVTGVPKDDAASTTAEEDDIMLTVCVDRIAASGGYMVAAQASRGRLFAAPFALVGSIGVYTERVNIHDALTRLGVRGLVLKAGKSKAPIGTIGEVSESGINAVQEDLDRVHDAFRSLVKDSRQVENGKTLSEVMEGECFLAEYAQELGLVDRTITSDAYIAERVMAGDKVLRLRRYDKPKAFGGLNLPLSPLDLLLSGGASEDLFGRLKAKVRASMSAINVADTVKLAGIIAGSLTLLKDLQHDGGQYYTKTTGPQARYTKGR